MAGRVESDGRAIWTLRRVAAWHVAGAGLLLPLAAMQVTDAVRWTFSDFLFAGMLIGGAGLLFELAVRTGSGIAYRAGAAIALFAALLMIWVTLAVGVIGSEGDPANLLLGCVLAVAVGGTIAAKGDAAALSRAMFATASAQAGVGLLAPVERFGIESVAMLGFALTWLLSGCAFRTATRTIGGAAR